MKIHKWHLLRTPNRVPLPSDRRHPVAHAGRHSDTGVARQRGSEGPERGKDEIVDFFYDPESGQRIFYRRAAHRPVRARRSPGQPTATAREPRALGAIVKYTIINELMAAHPQICRQLVREAVGLGIENALSSRGGWKS